MIGITGTTSTPGRFAGQTVIVSGAGAGIGSATTERVIADGGRVIAVDVVSERLDQLVVAVQSDRLITVTGDVADRRAIDQVVAAAEGRIDGLANVAGIMDGFIPTAELQDEVWDRVLAVNLTAAMRLTRAVLPTMIRAGRGSIVMVSSEASLRGSAAGTAYTTSMHALNGLTLSTAFYYAPAGIRCNAVAPGAVATSIEAPFRSQYAAERVSPYLQTNMPPIATAPQLAATITWLLSDDSPNVTGAVLPSDGGWSAV